MKNPFLRTGLAGLFALACSLPLFAAAPAWWAQRGVLTSGATPEDYAAVNLGQVKRIATLARDEFQARLPGGAGTAINTLVDSWAQPPASGVTRNDYAVVNQGQLKALAKLFYDRLALTVGYNGQPLTAGQIYPWTAATTDDSAYAAVNLGQVKQVFSFELAPYAIDADSDGLPDWWEIKWAGNLTTLTNPNADADGDGVTNIQAYHNLVSPFAQGYNFDFERGWLGWNLSGSMGQIATVSAHNVSAVQGTLAYQTAIGTGDLDVNEGNKQSTLTSLPFTMNAGTVLFSAMITGGNGGSSDLLRVTLHNNATGAELARLRKNSAGDAWELCNKTFSLPTNTVCVVKIVDADAATTWREFTVDDIRITTLPATFANFDFEQGASGWTAIGYGGQFDASVSDGQAAFQGSKAYQSATGTGTISSNEGAKTNELYSGTFTLTAGNKLLAGELFGAASSTLYVGLISANTGTEICRLQKRTSGATWAHRAASFTLASDTLVYLKIVDRNAGHVAVDALTITPYTFDNFDFEQEWVGWNLSGSMGQVEAFSAHNVPSVQGTFAYQSAVGFDDLGTSEGNKQSTLTSLPFNVAAGTVLFSAQISGGDGGSSDLLRVTLHDATSNAELARLRKTTSGDAWQLCNKVFSLAANTACVIKIVDADAATTWRVFTVDDIRVTTLPSTFTNFDFEQGSTGWTAIGYGGQFNANVSDGQTALQGASAYQSATGTGTISTNEGVKTNELYSGTFTLTAGNKLLSGELFGSASSSLYVGLIAANTGSEICRLQKSTSGPAWQNRGATFVLTADTLVYLKIVDRTSVHFAVDALAITPYTFDNFGFEKEWVGWKKAGGNGNEITTVVEGGNAPIEGVFAYQTAISSGTVEENAGRASNTVNSFPFTVGAGNVTFSAYILGNTASGSSSLLEVALYNATTNAKLAALTRSSTAATWQYRTQSLVLAAPTELYIRIVDEHGSQNRSIAVDDIKVIVTP